MAAKDSYDLFVIGAGSAYLPGYAATIPKAEFPTDTYALYLIRHERGHNEVIPTGEQLDIVNPQREGVKTNW